MSSFGCLLLALLFTLSVPPALSENGAADAGALKSVSITTTAAGAKIIVKADGQINNYNAFTLDSPPRIVFDLIRIKSPFKTSRTVTSTAPGVMRVRHFAHPDKTRLVIDTEERYLSEYEAQPVSDGLEIHVGAKAPQPPTKAVSVPDGANRLRTVAFDSQDDGIRITIAADEEILDYTSFALDDPARIVFDLYRLKSPFTKTQILKTDSEWVKAIRHFGHPDKVRLVLDTSPVHLSSYTAESLPEGLEIIVGKIDSPARLKAEEMAGAGIDIAPPEDTGTPLAAPTPLTPMADAADTMPLSDRLTLKQTIDGAIRATIGLTSSREGTTAALALKNVQRSALLPTLGVSYSLQHSYEEVNSPLFGVVQPQNQYALVGTASQPLFAGFSLVNQYQAAKMGVDVAKLNEKLLRQSVVFTAKQGYFSLLKAQKLLTVSQLSVELLEAHKTVANNFYQVGMIPLNELLKAQVELANARQNLIVVQNSLDIAGSNLNLILRRDINTPIGIVDVTDYAPFERDIAYCLEAAEALRLEMKVSDLDVKIKGKELSISRKDYVPSIRLRSNYYFRGTDWDVNGGPGISDPYSWDVSAVVSWNFWEWGRTAQTARVRRAGLNQAELKRDDIVDNIRLEVKQAYLKTREAEKNILTVQKAIEQAKENFRISEERYKEQMVTSTDVLDAQTLLSRTMNNYYNALYDFKISKAALYRAMGQEVLE